MSSIRLDFFTIRLREKGVKDVYVDFDSVFENAPFGDFFQKFAKTFEKQEVNFKTKKTFKFQGQSLKVASEKKMISGIIKSGEFGKTSEVEDVVTGEPKPPIGKNDSIISPFYFLVYFPANLSTGVVVLQRIGQQGMTADFKNYFKDFARNELDGMVVEFSPFVTKELLIEIIKSGGLNKVTLRKYNLVSDKFDKYAKPTEQLNAEFTLTTSGFFGILVKEKVESFIESPHSLFFDIPELERLGFDDNTETSIKVDILGTERTVVLNDLDRFKISFDIENEVELNPDGNPIFDSIDREAKKLINYHFNVQ